MSSESQTPTPDPKEVQEVCRKAVLKWGSCYKVGSVLPDKSCQYIFERWLKTGVIRDHRNHLECFEWLKQRV